MKSISGKLVALALLVPALAFAHAKGEHVKGTVPSVDANSLSIETPEKKVLTFKLDEKTKYEHSGQPAAWDHLEKGERVVVHAKKVFPVMNREG